MVFAQHNKRLSVCVLLLGALLMAGCEEEVSAVTNLEYRVTFAPTPGMEGEMMSHLTIRSRCNVRPEEEQVVVTLTGTAIRTPDDDPES